SRGESHRQRPAERGRLRRLFRSGQYALPGDGRRQERVVCSLGAKGGTIGIETRDTWSFFSRRRRNHRGVVVVAVDGRGSGVRPTEECRARAGKLANLPQDL